ncbi:MAG TPA: tRNA (adenosine(37)-N6)-threonylcarbamoyltransferase complex ATPase subunit type 1 TsaE [Methylocella sp.]|nr:tRNA (adenosine(37)-N6)-threonylcarbamoyltransferase complex ATPase subunit type 1 TsaE [Methylocella sp.]
MAHEAGNGETIWHRDLFDEEALGSLAGEVAALVGPGDLITLSGDLGAGKTAFARTLIRSLAGDPALEVPSPAFTLMQLYQGLSFPILHADFYRIGKAEELAELGFEEAADGALVLVEWPQRAEGFLDADRLDIAFALDLAHSPFYRTVTLTGRGRFAKRLSRAKAIDALLDGCGWRDADRIFMQGDASTRSYERLVKQDGESAVLMISPRRPDGPPIRYGKSYSAIARLAEDIKPFIALCEGLRAQGISTPTILAHDLGFGLALLEDLGHEPVVTGEGRIDEERYGVAVEVLAHLHGRSLPDTLPVANEDSYRIPPYDIDALLIEIELLLDWYVPYIACLPLASGTKANFVKLWRDALQPLFAVRPTWTLRDFHSPNLLWLAERKGLARVGVLDFQDCVLGHPAYDVVSLAQDARIDVPSDIELRLLAHYARLRQQQMQADFDIAAFARAYSILGAQRATKILGIFARLDERDEKPQYLVHLPRVEKYLAKNLVHPALVELRQWYEEHLPRIFDRT